MPKPLLARCRPDCVDEFRRAAEARFNDGLQLAAQGHRLGAIYLWGYSAEMAIKAAYFSTVGLSRQTPITWVRDLRPAIDVGRSWGISWPKSGEGHNVRAWAELLAREANANPAVVLDAQQLFDIQRHAQRVGQLWNETLRYRKNMPYAYELQQVRTVAEWLVVNLPLSLK